MKLRPGSFDERGRVALRIVQRDKTVTKNTRTAAAAAAAAAAATATTSSAAATAAAPSSGALLTEGDVRDKSRVQQEEMIAQGASQVYSSLPPRRKTF